MKENLVIYQKSLKAFLQAPLQLFPSVVQMKCHEFDHQLNMRRISIVCNNEYAISTILLLYYICVYIILYIYIYNCMFVSALPDPTCNSEKSANGGNKQILLLLFISIYELHFFSCKQGTPKRQKTM